MVWEFCYCERKYNNLLYFQCGSSINLILRSKKYDHGDGQPDVCINTLCSKH